MTSIKDSIELKIFGAVLLIAAFFTQGLPLFNEDYSVWIAQAQAGFLDLFLRLLSPLTSAPRTWGGEDRPLKAALYGLMGFVGGTSGAFFYFMKSAALAGATAVLFRLMRRLGIDVLPALLGTSLWVFSPVVLGPFVVHSQFAVYSQLAMLGLLLFSWEWFSRNSKQSVASRRKFSIAFVAAVYFGSKLGPEIVSVPLVWMLYLRAFEPAKFKLYAIPFGVSVLLCAPFSTELFTHLPPFLPGASAFPEAGFTPFSFLRLIKVLFADPLALQTPPASLIPGGMGWLLILGLIAFFVHRTLKGEQDRLTPKTGFAIVWLGVGILVATTLRVTGVYGDFAAISVALLPAIVCVSFLFKPFFPIAAVIVALTNGLHLYQSGVMRAEYGRNALAYHQAFLSVEAEMPFVNLVFLPGTPAYAFRDSTSQALRSRRAIAGVSELNSAAGTTLALGFSPPLDTSFALRRHYSGCGTLFDSIVPCPTTGGLFLMAYLGYPPEIATARQLEQSGDLQGAVRIYEAYLQNEPNNHGAIFLLSLLYDRLQNHSRFEEMNDRIGPYHANHSSIVYNWGLSKMRVGKHSEAVKHLEKAYLFYPNSYGPGFNLADAYHSAGMKKKAIRLLESLLAKYAGDPTMTQVLNQWKSEK